MPLTPRRRRILTEVIMRRLSLREAAKKLGFTHHNSTALLLVTYTQALFDEGRIKSKDLG